MSLLDAFLSTWSKARDTFGDGTPEGGAQFDGSSRLQQMQTDVQAAAPDDRWQGTAAEAYATTNQNHAAVYGKLAELDKRMAIEIDNAANVVTAGRQKLDDIKSWVVSAAGALPDTETGRQQLIPIVSKGFSEISDIIRKSTDGMTDIGGRVQDLKGEWEDVKNNQRFGTGSEKNDS